MTEEDRIDPKHVSFSIAQGYDKIPQPLKLGELDQNARNLIWSVIYGSLAETRQRIAGSLWVIAPAWQSVVSSYWVRNRKKPLDEFKPFFDKNVEFLKDLIFNLKINHVFDFLTLVLRHESTPPQVNEDLKQIFSEARLAYRIHDSTILPSATPQAGAAIIQAISDADGYRGAQRHLLDAAEKINRREYDDSVADSIHAVESVIRTQDPKSSKTLTRALDQVAKTTHMHSKLKEALQNLYWYSCDEEGVRHAYFEKGDDVPEEVAVFMLTACAAFVSLLIESHRTR